MIRRLRMRFIALAMASTAVVLLALMGAVNVVNYRSVISDADEVLALLAENGGSFPDFILNGQDMHGDPPEDLPEDMPEGWFQRGERGERGERGKKQLSDRLNTPELPFESRYFSAVMNEDCTAVTSVDTGMIAAVDEEEAAQLALTAWSGGSSSGFIGDYRYLRVRHNLYGLVVFLDCGRTLASARSFLLTSVIISAIGLASVFVLIALFSRRMVRPVAESYDKQRRFITDASHELKTPLAIIEADADVLEAEIGVSEWLEDIRTQTQRLAGLTADLVTLSRMDEGSSPFVMIDFPLSDVVEEAAASYHAPAMVQSIAFQASITPMLSVCGDEKAIRQLVGILLDNALKYTPQGGSIALTLDRQGRLARLSVSNTAQVNEADLDHLFDRFYRTDTSRNSATGGHGIGLSIAQAIVSGHKGKISAARQGDQLVITATLPLVG